MNKSRKFSPTDVYAIQNAQRLQSMLDESLDGKVAEKFTTLFGKPKQWSHRSTQLRDNNLYVLVNDQTDWKFIGCGFDFNEGDYPKLTVYIEVHPNCIRKKQTIDAIEIFCDKNTDWWFHAPSDDNDYCWGYAEKSIIDFLSEEDHIKGIQEFLISKLEELYQLKKDNPNMKWLG